MKKLLLLLVALLGLGVSGAWATDYTITYDTSTGTFYRSGSASTDWSSKWVSNEAGKPVVTITTSVNNMNGANGRIAPQTYTITTQLGYIVTGFSMNCPTFGGEITVTPSGESATVVSTNEKIVLNSSASSFVFSGDGTCRIQAASSDGGSFTITVTEDPWMPSFESGAKVSVGNKVTSFETVSEASDNSKWYVLTQRRDGETPMYNVGIGSTLKRTTTSTTTSTIRNTLVTDSKQYLFRLVGTGSDGIYNIQFADGSWIKNDLTTTSGKSNAGAYAFYHISGDYFAWNKDSKTDLIVNNNGAGNNLAFWGTGTVNYTTGNDSWQIYETTIGTSTVDITYKLYDSSDPSTPRFSETVTEVDGASLVAPASWARDGVTFTYYGSYSDGVFSDPITTVSSSNTTVYVKYSYSLSSYLSSSSSDLHYYRMAGLSKSVLYDLYCGESTPYYHRVQSSFDGSDGYFWAFVGNPYDGFKVYNKVYEGTKIMTYNSGTNPVMGSDDGTKWYISISNDGIGFKYTVNTSKRWNDLSGGANVLGYYSGETWYTLTAYDDVDYSSLYTANIKPYIDNKGDGFFKISSTDGSSLQSSYETANSDSKITVTEYQTLLTELAGYIYWPTTGYYRIKSVSADSYMKGEDASQLTVGGTGNEASSIVYLNGSAGTYTMQMQGKYMQAQSNSYAAKLRDASMTSYFHAPIVDGAVVPGKVTIGHGESATDNFGVSSTKVVGQATSSGSSTHWTVEAATSFTGTITDANDNSGEGHSYATLCVPFAISSLTGADAYAPTIDGDYIVMGDALSVSDGTLIAAGTPVILVGATDAGSYTATIKAGSAPATAVASTTLSGTFTSTTLDTRAATGTCYVLGFDEANDDRIGFYHVNNSAFPLSANRAYLDTSESNVKGFVISWNDETGIEFTRNNESMIQDLGIYNLAGQRMSKPQKGINLMGGKKVVIK